MNEERGYEKPWMVGTVAINPETGELHSLGEQGNEIRWWLLERFGSGSASVPGRRLVRGLTSIEGGAVSDSSKIKRPMDDSLEAKVPVDAEGKDGSEEPQTEPPAGGNDQEEEEN